LRHRDTLPTALRLLRRIGARSRVDQGKAHNALASLSQNLKRDVPTHRKPYQREPGRGGFQNMSCERPDGFTGSVIGNHDRAKTPKVRDLLGQKRS
jgi:hypothetical protein